MGCLDAACSANKRRYLKPGPHWGRCCTDTKYKTVSPLLKSFQSKQTQETEHGNGGTENEASFSRSGVGYQQSRHLPSLTAILPRWSLRPHVYVVDSAPNHRHNRFTHPKENWPLEPFFPLYWASSGSAEWIPTVADLGQLALAEVGCVSACKMKPGFWWGPGVVRIIIEYEVFMWSKPQPALVGMAYH